MEAGKDPVGMMGFITEENMMVQGGSQKWLPSAATAARTSR